MKRGARALLLIVFALPVAGLALAALAPFGGYVPGLAAHGAPWLAIAALPFWCWRGRRPAAGGIVLALALAALWPWLAAAWARRAPVAGDRAPLVAVANVWQGNPQRLAALAALDADLVVLIECHDADRPHLRHDPRWPHQLWNGGSGYEGLAVLSRLPLSAGRVCFPEGAAGIEAIVAFPGGPVRLIAAHTHSPKSPRLAERNRRQLAALADLARARPGPLLLAGDLNTTPDGLGVLAAAGLHPAATRLPATWPQPVPLIAIDHILARDLPLGRPDTAALAGGDHRALLVRAGASVP